MVRSAFLVALVLFVFMSNTMGQKTADIKTFAYKGKPEQIVELSPLVNETSGVIYFDEAIWTFNDSGGKPEIYRIDEKSGEISKTVFINNAKNNDWEDITMDEEFIYIGEFGNNWGNRKTLVIYKISQKEIIAGKTEVEAELIKFSYTDQVSFEKRNRSHNFDCESVISFGDSLILFSKNWEDNNTRMYKLPKEAGSYKLSPLDSFSAGGLVTGADYNKENGKLALIGYKQKVPFIFIMEDFNGINFDSENITKIDFPDFAKSQTEGIFWENSNTVIISSEETKEYKPSLYRIDIEKLIEGAKNE